MWDEILILSQRQSLDLYNLGYAVAHAGFTVMGGKKARKVMQEYLDQIMVAVNVPPAGEPSVILTPRDEADSVVTDDVMVYDVASSYSYIRKPPRK